MKKVLILGAGQMQVPVIAKAVQMGLEAIVADFNPKAPGIAFASKYLNISTIDKEAVLEAARKEKVDGILTTSDYPVNAVAYACNALGLPSMSEKVAKICTDKYMQRSIFRQSGIKTPTFELCDPDSCIDNFNEFPYIVKPCDSSASRGVRKVSDPSALREAFDDAMANSRSHKILIESFIEGREFSVETLTQNGVTTIANITEKLTKGEDEGFFVEDTHIEPARISEDEWKLIEKEVLAAISAIGLDNCPSHTEVKLNDRGAWIIEIACRLGGDYITSDLVPLSTGIDMLGNLVRLSIGEKTDTRKTLRKVSAVQFVNQENYDRCKALINAGSPLIKRCELEERHNRVIRNSLDRMGYIIFQSDDSTQIENILKQL